MIELLALPVLGAAGYALRRRTKGAATERAGMLRPCEALLTASVHGRDRTGYGMLAGRFGGVPVEIRLIPEALAFRRLPQLWLSVSVHRATGIAGTLDILRRVAGAEFYAPGDDLPARYPVPSGWPGETLVRGSRSAGDLFDRSAEPVTDILADPRVKEVLLTPRGVRIVSQLCEGDRGAYLLLRENRFPVSQVDPERLRPLLVQAADLARHLRGGSTVQGSEDVDARAAA